MATKINELTINEFKELVRTSIKEALEDILEDITALSSEEYLRSIQEARNEYKNGLVKEFKDVFNI